MISDGLRNNEMKELPYDMCSCSNCGWKGTVFDCETDTESDGWEYPTYTIHLCPECEDGGCIDDYWYKNRGRNINENGKRTPN